MNRYVLLVVVLSAMVTISTLYITQPLQPLLMEVFDISIAQVTLFTSVLLFILAIAPIVYGYLLEHFQTRNILCFALFAMGILQCALSFANSYLMFLSLRVLEALVLPAALTATLTTLTRLNTQNMQIYVSIYVAATTLGGVFSRVGGGLLTTLFSWQFTFIVLGITTLIVAILALKLPKTSGVNSSKITPKAVLNLLQDKRYLLLYAGAFLVLFCFQGALNFIPFELKNINPNTTPAQIGFLYIGYIIGIITALLSSRIVRILKGQLNTIVLGFFIFGCACLLMLHTNFWWLFSCVFVLCIGMFITHSVLSGCVNSISSEKKGITNGLYLAFYYTGGTLGATLPSFVYHHYGWSVLCILICVILWLSSLLFYLGKSFFKKA